MEQKASESLKKGTGIRGEHGPVWKQDTFLGYKSLTKAIGDTMLCQIMKNGWSVK